VVHRLTDHTSDVAGLEWSPDGRWLASCGLDSNVLIWDVAAGFKRVATLEGHKGFVKGLAWDPLGVYLASQSDDHSLIIWRTHDWQYETMLKKPFDQGNEETFFRRPSWSPDGAYVAAANAVNGRQPVVSLISRDQWKPEFAFVGHLLAVEVARFSPHLYRRLNPDGETSVGYLCAAGSQDCNTSLWTDKNSKPLAVLTDLFEHAVMDIEWLPSGLAFLAAAYDGTVARVDLNPTFVGVPLSAQEHAAHLATLHGGNTNRRIAYHLPTSVEQIKLQADFDQLKACVEAGPDNVMTSAMQIDVHPRQVETKTKEGKRRVAPLLVQTENSQQLLAFSQATTTLGSQLQPSLALKPVEPAFLQAPTVKKRLFVDYQDGRNVEVLNSRAVGAVPAETRIKFVDGDCILAEDVLESHALCMAADESGLVVAALQNKTLLVFSSTGRRLTPPLILEGSPISLACRNGSCLIVLETGEFKLWNLLDFSLLRKGSIAALVTSGALLSQIVLMENGSFRVSFVDCRVYEYVARMDTFVQSSGGIFKALEYQSQQDVTIAQLKDALNTDLSQSRLQSIQALECRLALSALQGDPHSFVSSLSTYIRRLVLEGWRERLLDAISAIARSTPQGFAFLQVNRRAWLLSMRPLLSGLPDVDGLLDELDFLMQQNNI